VIKLLKRTVSRLFRRRKPRVQRGLAALTAAERERLFKLVYWDKISWADAQKMPSLWGDV
jgi:hypothetical protein